MSIVHSDQRRLATLVVSLLTVIAFMLAACGSNSPGSSSTGSSQSPSAPTQTATLSSNTPTGCPSNVVVTRAPTAPDVLVKPSTSNGSIIAHVGNLIEIDLPFGHSWSGPSTSVGVLELQTPTGYAWNVSKACIWRFIARGTGTTQLDFTARALCTKGIACPQYALDVPVTIVVR